MRCYARFRLPDGTTRDLAPGELVGRTWTAALHLDDARVSEAHAMVSLRGRELKLLALRGRFAIDGSPLTELVLAPGQRIALARGVAIEVVEVVLPEAVLALEGDGLARTVLPPVTTLRTRPKPRIVPRFDPEGAARLWSTGETWRLQLGDADARTLDAGDPFSVDDRRFVAVEVPLGEAAPDATRVQGAIDEPLTLVAQFDTVHIQRGGELAVALGGLPARLVSELVAVDGPVGWEALAREVWGPHDDTRTLRRKLDVNLSRLRKKLREARVRPDLVRADGAGHLELLLAPGDRVDDRT